MHKIKQNSIWVKSGQSCIKIQKPSVYDHNYEYHLTADSQRVVAGMLYFHRRMLPFVIVMLNTALVLRKLN